MEVTAAKVDTAGKRTETRAPEGQATEAKATRVTRETSVATEVATNLVPLATEEVEAEVEEANSHLAAIPTPNQRPLPTRSLSPNPSLTTEDLPVGGRLYNFRDN